MFSNKQLCINVLNVLNNFVLNLFNKKVECNVKTSAIMLSVELAHVLALLGLFDLGSFFFQTMTDGSSKKNIHTLRFKSGGPVAPVREYLH